MTEGERKVFENSFDQHMKALEDYWNESQKKLKNEISELRNLMESSKQQYLSVLYSMKRVPSEIRNAIKEAHQVIDKIRNEKFELHQFMESTSKENLDVILKICKILEERDEYEQF